MVERAEEKLIVIIKNTVTEINSLIDNNGRQRAIFVIRRHFGVSIPTYFGSNSKKNLKAVSTIKSLALIMKSQKTFFCGFFFQNIQLQSYKKCVWKILVRNSNLLFLYEISIMSKTFMVVSTKCSRENDTKNSLIVLILCIYISNVLWQTHPIIVKSSKLVCN